MTIDELEAISSQPSEEDGVIVADIIPPAGDDEDDFVDPRIATTVDKIMHHFFGAKPGRNVKKSRKGLENIITDLLEDTEEMTQDLSSTLDLLEDSLFLIERAVARRPDLIGTELIDHMEEVGDHLGQWNMGDSSRNPKQD